MKVKDGRFGSLWYIVVKIIRCLTDGRIQLINVRSGILSTGTTKKKKSFVDYVEPETEIEPVELFDEAISLPSTKIFAV